MAFLVVREGTNGAIIVKDELQGSVFADEAIICFVTYEGRRRQWIVLVFAHRFLDFYFFSLFIFHFCF